MTNPLIGCVWTWGLTSKMAIWIKWSADPSILSFFPQDFRRTHSGWWYTYPSVVITIPNTWNSKKCSKPPTSIKQIYAVSLAVWPSAVSQCLFSFPQPITTRWQQHFVPQDWQNYQTLLGWNRWYTCWKILFFSMGFSHMFHTFFYDFTSYKPSYGLPGWQRCRPRCGGGWQGLGPQALNDQWIGSFSSFVGKQTRNHGFCHKMLWNI